jgi:DNA-binding beta-propeller fold protein YncE
MIRSLLLASAALLAAAAPATAQQADPGRILVLEKNAATARMLDAGDGDTIATWAVDDGPHEVAISPDGRLAVVANYGGQQPGSSLSVLDLTAVDPRRQMRTIDLGEAVRPHGLAFAGDSRHLWLTAETVGGLWRVDVKSGEVKAKVDVGGGGGHMVARADDSMLYVSHIGAGAVTPVASTGHGDGTMTAPAGWKAGERIATGPGAEGIAMNPVTGMLWVGNRAEDTLSLIDPAKGEVVARLDCPGFPIRVYHSPDGLLTAVSCATSHEVALYEAATHELLARIPMGDGATPIGMVFDGVGNRLYVACAGLDQVAAIDLRLRKVVATMATGSVPDGIAWLPTPPPQTAAMMPAQD